MRQKGTQKKPNLKPSSEKFVEMMATPGVKKVEAFMISNPEQKGMDTAGVKAWLKAKRLRDRIEERKAMAAEIANITPEMVLGATAMRAFASLDDAFDNQGNFDIKLARESGAIHLVKKLKQTQYGLEAEFYSNESAQDKLGNYLGMEFAPKDNSDADSLKAGVEAVARAIAKETDTEVNHEIRIMAWERVSEWAKQNRAKYSQKAIQEVDKHLKDAGALQNAEAEG